MSATSLNASISRSKVPPLGMMLLTLTAILTAGIIGGALAYLSVYPGYAAFIFPILTGIVISVPIIQAAKLGRVHSVAMVTITGLLTALAAYGLYHYGQYLLYQYRFGATAALGSASSFSEFVKALFKAGVGGWTRFTSDGSVTNSGPTYHATLAWLYWGGEILLCAGTAVYYTRKAVNIPFCDLHNRFTVRQLVGRVPGRDEEQFYKLAKAGDWKAAGPLMVSPEAKLPYPQLQVWAHKCPHCNTNDVPINVTGTIYSTREQLARTDSGSNRARSWLKTTLTPAQFDELIGNSH